MRIVDVIIPTLGAKSKFDHPYTCFENLHHIPWPIRLHLVNGGKTWAEAINIGLKQTDGSNDVILMDDDVFINKDTFNSIEKYYDQADIFGFKLKFANGKIQHYGGFVRNGTIGHIGWGMDDKFTEPIYACHATTSLIYIKRHVIDNLKGMSETMPGVQMEDVDFNFRAIESGYKILIVPEDAIHLESATKKYQPKFQERINEAFQEITNRYLKDEELVAILESYPQKMKVLA